MSNKTSGCNYELPMIEGGWKSGLIIAVFRDCDGREKAIALKRIEGSIWQMQHTPQRAATYLREMIAWCEQEERRSEESASAES